MERIALLFKILLAFSSRRNEGEALLVAGWLRVAAGWVVRADEPSPPANSVLQALNRRRYNRPRLNARVDQM